MDPIGLTILRLSSDQSYKHFTLVNYDSRVNFRQLSGQYNSRVVIYDCKMFIKLATQ